MTPQTLSSNIEKTALTDLALAINPVKFSQSLGIDPDPWQADVLLSAEKRIMILAARQSGKSMICAIYALWHALNNPGAVVLVLSPSLRQSSLLFRQTIIKYYRELGRPVPSDIETALTLQLANKSRIHCLPGLERTVRGYSGVSLLILDESALIEDDLYRAVRPMLAVSDGRIFAIGTPHGKRGWFYHTWQESDEFYKIKVTADQCPRISEAFLEQELTALGQYWYGQEFFCEWHDSATSLFRMDVIEQSIDDFEEIKFDLDLNPDDAFDKTDIILDLD
ncbi:MAG: terminase family protein [Euryarchaeota archaeon]